MADDDATAVTQHKFDCDLALERDLEKEREQKRINELAEKAKREYIERERELLQTRNK